jgi:transcriptional regulator with XRE-family HTH domain
MTYFSTGIHDLAEWRDRNGIDRRDLAAALDLPEATLARWESGEDHPPRPTALRLMEIMRPDAAETFALAKLMVRQSRGLCALFDFSGVRLICASLGLAAVWPRFYALIGTSVLQHLSDEGRALMQDAAFLRDVRQGRVLGLSGVSERPLTLATDPGFRHRWTALFRAFGPVLVADLTYERTAPDEALGVLDILHFDQLERSG